MATLVPPTGDGVDAIGARSSSYKEASAPRGLDRSRAVHRAKSSDPAAPRNAHQAPPKRGFTRPPPVYGQGSAQGLVAYAVADGAQTPGYVVVPPERRGLGSVAYDVADEQSPGYAVVPPERRGLGSVAYDVADEQSPGYVVVPPERRGLGSVAYDQADPQTPEYVVVPAGTLRRGLGSVTYDVADPQSPEYVVAPTLRRGPGSVTYDQADPQSPAVYEVAVPTLRRGPGSVMCDQADPQSPAVYEQPQSPTYSTIDESGHEYSECLPGTPAVTGRASGVSINHPGAIDATGQYDNVGDYDNVAGNGDVMEPATPTHRTVKITRVSMC